MSTCPSVTSSPVPGDQDRLAAALDGFTADFIQRCWLVSERHWERTRLSFVHAKKWRSGGTDEAMVMVRLIGERLRVRRYLLPHSREEWLSCDPKAFEGFLEEGLRGLQRGRFKIKPTYCSCGYMIHRSGIRANRFAKELARRYRKGGLQRSYRCSENPRAFHLTAQQWGSRDLIPDAYIDPFLDRLTPGGEGNR
jgi:hypothetical protein